jgi:hypothetical protein
MWIHRGGAALRLSASAFLGTREQGEWAQGARWSEMEICLPIDVYRFCASSAFSRFPVVQRTARSTGGGRVAAAPAVAEWLQHRRWPSGCGLQATGHMRPPAIAILGAERAVHFLIIYI